MGCWNQTCGLTQMPIYAGDEVVMFFLVSDPFDINPDAIASYQCPYWSPIPLPFYGTYDDYGHLEMHEGQEWKLKLIKDAFGRVVVVKEPKDQYVDNYRIDENVFDDYEVLKDAIHRDRLVFNLYGRRESTVSFVMFDRKVFDTLCAPKFPEKLQASFTDFLNFLEEKRSELQKPEMDDKAKLWLELFELKPERALKEFCEKKKIKGWWEDYKNKKPKPPTFSMLHYWFDGIGGESTGSATRYFLGNIAYTPQELKDHAKDCVDTYLAYNILDSLRKIWVPPCHAGSQDGIHADHDVFIQAYTARLEHIKHQWDEDEE